MAEWFDDDSFWTDFYPFMFSAERFHAAEIEVDGILACTTLAGKSVLDLCCGPGRHSVELARRGFQVTGVDRTAFFLKKAAELAQVEEVEVEWVRSDMREFVRPATFDLALNLFTSFGYFDDKDDDIRVLRNVHDSLKPGGSFVLDLIGKERLAKVFLGTTSDEAPDGSVLVQRHQVFDDWSRVRNEWMLIKGDLVKTHTFHHTIYSGQEIKDRLRQVGFGEIRLFGDFESNEYDVNAKRLIAVATKNTG